MLTSEVRQWIERELAVRAITLVDPPVEHETQAWSATWRLPTDRGTFWFKQSGPAHPAEGPVHRAVAVIAPAYVEKPIAIEPDHRWLITRDGGTTMLEAAPDTRGIEVDALVHMLTDYADLQHRTAGHRDVLLQAGMRGLDPRTAHHMARSQADFKADLPPEDPRYLDEEQHQQIIAAVPTLEAAGAALADGPVPYAVDHGDLWPRNVFLPRTAGGPYRLFDLADAAWTHPFTSLVMITTECIYRWKVEQPDDCINLRDARIREVCDAYLGAWTEFAPLPALRRLLQHALRIAPLHRSSAWLDILETADTAALAKHGPTPWAWLQDVAKPVLI